MTEGTTYRTGMRVRLCCALPSAPEGAEGNITRIISDNTGQVTALEVLIDSDPANIHGVSAYPREVTLLAGDGTTRSDDA